MISRRQFRPTVVWAIAAALTIAGLACDRSPDASSSEDATAESESPQKESPSPDQKESDEPNPTTNEESSSADPAESDDEREPATDDAPTGSTTPRPEPRAIAVGTTLEDGIAPPESLESRNLKFETDWYAVHVGAGETVEISVEPGADSSLQPMVTVLLPDPDEVGEWSELDARRSRKEGERVQFEVTFEETGTKLITVDDSRNLPRIGDDEAPDSFHGGSQYTYTFTLRDPSAPDAGP